MSTRRFIHGISMAALALGLLMGCDSPVSGRAPVAEREAQTDDSKITTRVKAKLADEAPAGLGTIGVETNGGVVQLTGVVASAAMKERAAEIVRGVTGVRDVVNNLNVQSS
jgi:osmotically-inducible protein OsmY